MLLSSMSVKHSNHSSIAEMFNELATIQWNIVSFKLMHDWIVINKHVKGGTLLATTLYLLSTELCNIVACHVCS